MSRTMVLLVAALTLALTGCGASGIAESEKPASEAGGMEPAPGNSVTIGGFEVVGYGGEPIPIPEAATSPSKAARYLREIRPIVGDEAPSLSGTLAPEAQLRDGELSLTVADDPVRQAREAAFDVLERLREVEPPDGLELIHDTLVDSYEHALPAYDNIIDAFDSGSAERLNEAVEESLPLIERYNAVSRVILDELSAAEGEMEESHG